MKAEDLKRSEKALQKKQAGKGQNALITIITPFDPAESNFVQTFRSVMNQTFPWFLWIVVDWEESAFNNQSVLSRLAEMDGRIQILRHTDSSADAAIYAAIRRSRTEIVVVLQPSDLLAPQYLEYVYFGFYFHKNAACCYTDVAVFQAHDENGYLPGKKTMADAAAFRRRAAEELYRRRMLKQESNQPVSEQICQKQKYEMWRKKQMHCLQVLYLKGAFYRKRKKAVKTVQKAEQKQYDIVSSDMIVFPVKREESVYYRPDAMERWSSRQISSLGNQTKILLLVPWLVMGGADRLNLDLTKGLSERNFQISIMTTVPSENDWQEYFMKYTDEIFHLPDFLAPEHYVEFVSYYIRTRSVDVIFVSNSYRGYYMLPLLRKQFPKLCIIDYVHMEEWYWKAGGYARLSGMFGAFLEKTYVCNSVTQKVMTEEFGRDRGSVDVMYIGVDEKRFDPDRVREGYVYQRICKVRNLSEKRPIILFPCRICAQKRPFLMLEIVQQLIKKRPDVLIAVAGDGPQKKALEKETIKRRLQNNVIFLGAQKQMELCYKDAALTLICSMKEGLALTAYESCAMGTPVISSDTGGQKDLIDDETGVLVPLRQKEDEDFNKKNYDPKEVQAYVTAILRMLTDESLYRACSENCRNKIVSRFTTTQMLDQMEQELTKLLQENNRAEKRNIQSLEMRRLGFLAEEMYAVELAEEERSFGSYAAMKLLDKILDTAFPQRSRQRELAVRICQKQK